MNVRHHLAYILKHTNQYLSLQIMIFVMVVAKVEVKVPSNLQYKPSKSRNLEVSSGVLRLSLPNPLKPGVNSKMKM